MARRGLVLDLVHDDGFDHLGSDDRARDLEDRLVGEEQTALGHGADAASETEFAEEFQKVRGEDARAAQVVDAVVVKSQRFQAIQSVVYAGGDQVAPVGGVLAHVQAERGLARDALGEIRLGHGQLVEVGEQANFAGGQRQVRGLAGQGHRRESPRAVARRSCGMLALSGGGWGESNSDWRAVLHLGYGQYHAAKLPLFRQRGADGAVGAADVAGGSQQHGEDVVPRADTSAVGRGVSGGGAEFSGGAV